jgi:dTDP-4-dehydrorhamnose reductase
MASDACDVAITVREIAPGIADLPFFSNCRIYEGVNAGEITSVRKVIQDFTPHAVVNCIGIVKQDKAAKDPIASITVNSLFPHLVARESAESGALFIHVSTDCVFRGDKGGYVESDPTDATDLYGQSKALGEVHEAGLTLRTSIIGRELRGKSGLVEWFASQRGGTVNGFTKAVFSGFTTHELSRILLRLVVDGTPLRGLYHVSAEPINKDRLLRLIVEATGWPAEIVAKHDFAIDRSLDSSRFRRETGYQSPSWEAMVQELAQDALQYDSR